MKYCTECVYPDTKPDIVFNKDGICSACTAFKERANIDWKQREQEFRDLIYSIKQMKFQYDCIVPVSGGKDSTYQVIKAKEYGLRVLAVTATTDHLSKLGRHNLDNISLLGVDHIEISVDKLVRKRIAKYALTQVGDISWAEHHTIFTIPVLVAIRLGVPLILWGESPQNEYGGPYEAQKARLLTERWLSEFGGLNGLRVRDLIDQGIATEDELRLYTYPKLIAGNLNNPSGVFLGSYLPWDGWANANIAEQYGFRRYDYPVEGCGFDYENLDNLQTGVHDLFKFTKYGFGRATDLVSNHIRRGRMTREQGIAHCKKWDGQWPSTYLGVSLEEILRNIDMTLDEFIPIVKQFTNKDLFEWGDRFQMPFPKFEIGKNA